MRLALVGFFPTARPGGRSGSGVGAVSCAQSSWSLSSIMDAGKPWWTLVWQVWHW